NIDCIINGESIGQVASQTIESMKVVNEVTNIPILRPLLTYDKTEIIEIARKIKTYDISIRPFDDCCTIFVPKHPVIKPTIKKAIYEEEKCNLQQEIEQAIKNIEIIELSSNNHYSVLEIDTNQDKFEI
ncbi:MAG TPA: tRNA 4-thiouridine(8) synthase ThiI, partial [Bacilli bacterium]|nr:tRNA 4-thiouridine(8) synthase ThiI [Bacilli bacterium]